MYYVLLDAAMDRAAVIEEMKRRDIWPVFHYVPLHSSPAGLRYGRPHGALDITDSISQRLIRLPLWVGITEAQQAEVVAALAAAIG